MISPQMPMGGRGSGVGEDPPRLGRRSGYDHDPAFGYEVSATILLDIVADLRSRQNDIGFVDDGLPYAAAPPYLSPIHNDRVFDEGVAVNSNVPADDRLTDQAAADNRAFADD